MSLTRRAAGTSRHREQDARALAVDALRGEIERYGWALQHVEASGHEPSLAYTVGLGLRGLPELAVRGLAPEQSWIVLNDAAGRSTAGSGLTPGTVLSGVVAGIAVQVRAMTDVSALEVAHEVCAVRGPVRALELVRPARDRAAAAS